MSGRAPWTPSIAPSPVRLKTGKSLFDQVVSCIVFNEPREMTESDIEEVKEQFRKAAVLAKETGFDGIQLHCSHGYLLASFLSPKVSTSLMTILSGRAP
jgi:2,4-dienoyl-CoA reductase-like NADH-dependent reductase (Old Yellow Enzyme family)